MVEDSVLPLFLVSSVHVAPLVFYHQISDEVMVERVYIASFERTGP